MADPPLQMKIVHVTPTYIPQLGYQENYLPFEQAKRGHEVHILTSNSSRVSIHNDDISLPDVGTYRRNNVTIHRIPSYSIDQLGVKIFSPHLESRLVKEKPDIIHSHEITNISSLRASLSASFLGCKSIVDVHIDNDNFKLDSCLKKCLFNTYRKIIVPVMMESTDGFLAVNPEAKIFLEEELSIPRDRIDFLPLGVDIDEFPDMSSSSQITREDLGIPQEDLLAITVGNLNETKDIDILLESMKKLSDESLHLLIIGTGPKEYMKELKHRVKSNGIDEKVTFLGVVPHEELHQYYNAADIGIWPGKLGVSIIEAISTGLPIIVCSSPATEYYASYDNGLTFDRGNQKELRDRISKYMRCEELRQKHAKNSREFAAENLAWPEIAEKSLNIYKGH
ncbi:glycosyltransferase [Halomontanus rarus]|uniref:glycosyltransferase n=1 Tax=Halomontanus rarus TaxID=3034020 RepID=UPI001A99EB5B